ncbi:hypothetical protein RJT34_01475 [Clitoria ternatea]|uniref:RNase H type-1 domain-containing protein n=1 Tax=Clitoria ternatea TaxID=43366 RepID=A0AAN9KJG2_CLITE
MAESRGKFEGIKMAKDLQWNKLNIQVDSTVIFQRVSQDMQGVIDDRSVLQAIKKILHNFEQTSIQYVYREAKSIDDHMNNIICDQSFGIKLFNYPPIKIMNELRNDSLRTLCCRFV